MLKLQANGMKIAYSFVLCALLVDLMERAKSACDLCHVLSMEISPCVCIGSPLRQIRGSTELWP
jgi:hypothetical protein